MGSAGHKWATNIGVPRWRAAVQDGAGFVITEYWESEQQARFWYDSTVRPSLAAVGMSGFETAFMPIHNLLLAE